MRMRAVDFLGYRTGDAEEVVPALTMALGDYHLRESALHSLIRFGPEAAPAIRALIEAFRAHPKQPATRWLAADVLAGIGDAAKPSLQKGTASKDLYERLWSTATLAKMEGAQSPHFETLATALASADKKTAQASANALTMIGATSKVVLEEIVAAMDNPVAAKTDLAMLLSKFGKDAKPAVPNLVKWLDDTSPITRQRSAYALSEIGGADIVSAIPGLLRMLDAEQGFVREKATVALGSIGKEARGAAPDLIKVLGDKNEHVRSAAAVRTR